MKKLLLSSAAVCGLAMIAAPAAQAQISLELGGFFKGYGAYVNQDEEPQEEQVANPIPTAATASEKVNDFDIIRHTEIHIGGETTLDNGLTVGFHTEADADGGNSFNVQESYAYFSGSWGRVNFGAEDGAAYLLQVAAPAADSNIDGIRQYVNPINFNILTADTEVVTADRAGNIAAILTAVNGVGAAINQDYEQNATFYDDKLTYLSPIMNGFQAGLSYTPDTGAYAGSFGIGTDDVVGTPAVPVYGEAYEGSLRYEGQFNNVGVIAGAGYTHMDLENGDFTGLTGALPAGEIQAVIGDATDDRTVWNVGLDLDIGPFGIGAIYKEDDNGERVMIASTATASSVTGKEEETFVLGADYTTGPFKFGVSYFDQENTLGITNLDTERYSGGVTYTYGPGMTLRGSVGHVEIDGIGIGGNVNTATSPDTTRDSVDATYVTIGTQINF